jgi:NAD(P)-dependent dehydrogenase (short-subunit alcohol dehydrogenase family)
VAVNAPHPAECASLVEEIESGGGRAVAVPGNVGSLDGCEAIAAAVTMRFERIDILVNSAAVSPQSDPRAAVDQDATGQIWEVNVLGPLRLTRYAADRWMRPNGGSIVNVAWIPNRESHTRIEAYRPVEAALISVTRTLAQELAAVAIRVNAIATLLGQPNVAQVLVDADRIPDEIDGQIAPRRIADPDDVASSALYLASDASSSVSGSILVADGGWSA